jgi:hypothetical protein
VVAREAREDIGLADAAVPDEHHLEQVRVLVIHPPPHLSPLLSSSCRRGDLFSSVRMARRRRRKKGFVNEGKKREVKVRSGGLAFAA